MKIAEEKWDRIGNDNYFPFLDNVTVIHQDGSEFKFRYATWEDIDDFWLAVFSEHNGCHVFAKPDLSYAISMDKGVVRVIYAEIVFAP